MAIRATLRNQMGFTLIELLITVAIIAILAAIAVPNFLEAQTRSKVSRSKADFKTLQTALETFRVDHNDYPSDVLGVSWEADYEALAQLTTPVAYISSVIASPFDAQPSNGRRNYSYWRDANIIEPGGGIAYHVTSTGPNGKMDLQNGDLVPLNVHNRLAPFVNGLYDPTNGTVSHGDLHLTNFGIS
jgi:type II secretion system protein G